MKKRNLIVASLVFALVLLVTGTVAYFVRTVNGNITGQAGNLVFNVNGLTGETSEVFTYSLNRSEEEPYVYPDDKGYFDLEISAIGSTTDVYVTLEVIRENLPDNLKFYADEDYNAVINKDYILLEKTGTLTTTKRIYWFWDGSKDDVNDSLFINQTLTARIKVSATPFEYGMMQNVLTELSPMSTETVSNKGSNATVTPMSNVVPMISGPAFQPENLVSYVEFTNNFSVMPTECTEENLCYDISYSEGQKYPVYAYFVSNSDGFYNLYIVCEKTVVAPPDSSELFANFVYLYDIRFNNLFNTSFVTDAGHMFGECFELLELDTAIFDTSNVTDMSFMFSACGSLIELDLSNFDTRNVTDMQCMFSGLQELTELDLSSFDTSSVTTMDSMFSSCSNLSELDLSNFDTSSVTSMSGMFYNCLNLTELDLSVFDTSKVTTMSSMFSRCSNLSELDLSSFDTSKVAEMFQMFEYAPLVITEITLWTDVNTNYMFRNGATDPNSRVVLNYTSAAENIVNNLVNGTTIIKGSLVS